MNAPADMDNLTTHPVHRQDGIALWRHIVGKLKGDIASGGLKPGTQLPTEAALSVQFGVNRHTLRRALEELSRGGLVRVEHGRGAFVPEDVMEYAVEPRTRFSEWVRRHNKEPSGRVLRLAEEPAKAAAIGQTGAVDANPHGRNPLGERPYRNPSDAGRPTHEGGVRRESSADDADDADGGEFN